jgi:hypothetical protein
MDEMRVGQKGRLCHRWWTRGKRPPGVQDQRHEWAYLFGAARPGGEAAFALVLPTVNTDTMQIFLDRFAETLAKDERGNRGHSEVEHACQLWPQHEVDKSAVSIGARKQPDN